jgi:hypothetical protein
MKKALLAFAFLLTLPTILNAEELTFGEPVNMELIKSLDTLMSQPKDYVGKEVTIKGKIEKVCKKRGCWADFVADDKKLRVKVADGEIEIPLYTIGKDAYATGVLHSTELNKEQTIAYLKHMADDAGEDFDPSTVKQGITLYQLKSNSVKIL